MNTPTFARALQHALIAVIAVATLVAAGTQIQRNNVTLAAIDLIIATLLALLLSQEAREQGRIFSNYSLRYPVRRTRKQHTCAWCGETIPSGDMVVLQVGAVAGERYAINHHPECADAVSSWIERSANPALAHDMPTPTIRRMERGQPYSRADGQMRAREERKRATDGKSPPRT